MMFISLFFVFMLVESSSLLEALAPMNYLIEQVITVMNDESSIQVHSGSEQVDRSSYNEEVGSFIGILNQQTPAEICDYLQKNSRVVRNNYESCCYGFNNIQDHITQCLTLFNQHFQHLIERRFRASFKLFLCLHDIGKHDVDEFNGSQTKANKQRLLDFSEEKKGFPEPLLKIYLALLSDDIIGPYLQEEYGSDYAEDSFRIQASKVDLPLSIFFKLSVIYYLCDAGSYYFLKEELSLWSERQTSGRYRLQNKDYEEKLSVLEQQILKNSSQYQFEQSELDLMSDFELSSFPSLDPPKTNLTPPSFVEETLLPVHPSIPFCCADMVQSC